jgi:hypothetical protein
MIGFDKANYKKALDEAGFRAAPGSVNYAGAIAIVVWLSVLIGMVYGPMAAFLAEMFPANIRSTSLSRWGQSRRRDARAATSGLPRLTDINHSPGKNSAASFSHFRTVSTSRGTPCLARSLAISWGTALRFNFGS